MATWISPKDKPCETLEEACERGLCLCFNECEYENEEELDEEDENDE